MSAPQRNFLALATGEVGSRVLGFAATALLARRVGADGFGILGFALARHHRDDRWPLPAEPLPARLPSLHRLHIVRQQRTHA